MNHQGTDQPFASPVNAEAEKKGDVPETVVQHPHHDGTGDVEVGVDGQRALSRKLKNRHMQMIAIGGSIGAGLFVGSGSALAAGGPGSLVCEISTPSPPF